VVSSICILVDTFDEEGDKVAYSQMTVFIRGAGEFGGPQTSSKQIMCVERPTRKPDASRIQATLLDQVLHFFMLSI